MMVNDITAQAGAAKRRKRVGRGESSGQGKTCGRGHKGARSRSGCDIRPLTEGGQMPLFRRLPKRGFNNFNFRREYQIVNIGTLNERFDDGDKVDIATLQQCRLVQARLPRVRILGKGKLEKKLTVEAHAFSQHAREVIEQAGGTVSLIECQSPAEKAAAKRNTAKTKPQAQLTQEAGQSGAEEVSSDN